MKWATLVGSSRSQPSSGNWRDWKEQIAVDCQHQCIYCAISEARFGGIRNFHVEHFRPKVRFDALENEISNLYLACSICNVLKCDDWPDEPASDHSVNAYPDPSAHDYNSIFSVEPSTKHLDSSSVAGLYVIERLMLNRYQLILERRLSHCLDAFRSFENWVRSIDPALGYRTEVVTVLLEICNLKGDALTVRPYRDPDTKGRRPRRDRDDKSKSPKKSLSKKTKKTKLPKKGSSTKST